eukprot:s1663_g2.t1
MALVLGLHAATFVGVGRLFTEEQRAPKRNLHAVDVEAEPEVDTQALLTGERYIASNRWFSLMRRLPNDQQSFPDEYSYVSFTIWETKKDFTFWRKGLLPLKSAEQRDRLVSGPGGRPEAEGEELLEPEVFVATTRFNVLDQSKTELSPSRPADTTYVLSVLCPESFLVRMPPRLHSDVFRKSSGIVTFRMSGIQSSMSPLADRIQCWRLVQDAAGFRFSQLLRRDQAPDDNCNYLRSLDWGIALHLQSSVHGVVPCPHCLSGVTVWDDRAAYDQSEKAILPPGDMLLQPAQDILYEGKLASLCSAKVAGQAEAGLASLEPLADCAGRSASRIPMQLADERVLEADRINKWTKDLGSVGQHLGPGLASTLTCGRAQAAPENYLADAQDSQAIIMDSREGPAFVDYAGMEDMEFGLHPGEMNEKARAQKAKLREKDVLKSRIQAMPTPREDDMTNQLAVES